MGFHRRIINEKVTKHHLNNQSLELLYSSEALIFMDEYSSKVFECFKNGESYENINLKLELTEEEEKNFSTVEPNDENIFQDNDIDTLIPEEVITNLLNELIEDTNNQEPRIIDNEDYVGQFQDWENETVSDPFATEEDITPQFDVAVDNEPDVILIEENTEPRIVDELPVPSQSPMVLNTPEPTPEVTEEDVEKIIEALENPPQPNETLINEVNNYKNLIK